MRSHIKDIILSIESFLESRDDLMPLSQFTRVDLLIYQADALELFPGTLYNPTDPIQSLRIGVTEIYREERADGLACKRRRISL